MGGCSFPGCHNSTEKRFKILRFPRCPDIRNQWVSACKILKPITDNSRLCEGHFSKGLFVVERYSYKLKKNVVPDILVPSPPKPFETDDGVNDNDDDSDDNRSLNNKRRKSEVFDLTKPSGKINFLIVI
ncbi:GSCOCG00012733001-RA-CDS [Cotesia congregata]|nr:GSCOCG00012733001-RA-CDS [Cotesia congregata]